MWPARTDSETVTCVACGTHTDRELAREYDKYGNRWERDGKEFEYFCTVCHDDLCHHARTELEELLVEIDAGECSRLEFLSRYVATVEDRYGPLEER